jgi:hypothetical protein
MKLAVIKSWIHLPSLTTVGHLPLESLMREKTGSEVEVLLVQGTFNPSQVTPLMYLVLLPKIPVSEGLTSAVFVTRRDITGQTVLYSCR